MLDCSEVPELWLVVSEHCSNFIFCLNCVTKKSVLFPISDFI